VQNLDEKKAIGKKAAELIEDGDTVLLDLGTTTLEVAKNLKSKHNITILTNSIKIALELVDIPDNRVILLGGELRQNELSTSGFLTDINLKQFCVDKAIIGVGGITIENGVTDYHMQEAQARRLMIDVAEKVIAVTDFSKFGVNAFMHVCALKRIETIVTDWKVHPKIVQQLREQDIQVLIAEK
jgi:DeoR/GlpR family transcriptional regulator of sugar metabolism